MRLLLSGFVLKVESKVDLNNQEAIIYLHPWVIKDESPMFTRYVMPGVLK